MSSKSSIYQIHNLKQAYQNLPVIDIPALSIEQNRIIGLMGPNGSGKSTLLKLLGFIEAPLSGEIIYRGTAEKPFSPVVRSKVVLLPQTPYLLRRTVFDNVAYGLKLKQSGLLAGDQVHQAMKMVGLDEQRFSARRWHELSGGEAQRVALAARLVLQPDVLLLDEPTASVDAASVQLIKQASLQAQHEWGTTIIVASHDRQWLYDICDECLFMFNGRIYNSIYDNIVFGPWVLIPGQQWAKEIKPGMYLYVPKPPAAEAAAMIDPKAITIQPVSESTGVFSTGLTGIITQLSLEKKSNLIAVSVNEEAFSLTALSAEAQIRQYQLVPGQKVRLNWNLDAVHWIYK